MLEILIWLQHHSIVTMLAVFLLIVITTYWTGRKFRLQRNARIPLDDDR